MDAANGIHHYLYVIHDVEKAKANVPPFLLASTKCIQVTKTSQVHKVIG